MNLLVETRVDKKSSFEFEKPTLSLGQVAINKEGASAGVSGVKIGDGTTTWDQLNYINVPSDVVDKWLTIAEGTNNSKLVTLPDLNFAYSVYDVDSNSELEEIVKAIANRNIYFSVNDKPTGSSAEVGDLSLTAKGYLTLQYLVDNSVNDSIKGFSSLTLAHEKNGTRTYEVVDAENRSALKSHTTDFNNYKSSTNSSISSLQQRMSAAEAGTSLPLFSSGNQGLVPSSTHIAAGQRPNYFLNANGTWTQISLYADGIKLSANDSTTVLAKLNALQSAINSAGSSLSITSVGNTATTYYLTGVQDTSSTALTYTTGVYFKNAVLYGAAWNDYAEYRPTVQTAKPGNCVIEIGDGTLKLSTERLQPGCEIISDTFGFAIGGTEDCKTPIACTGRVLAYTYEDRYSYQPGDPVCSGPNGTVSRMTREEVINYPDRMIGTVSEIPEYQRWGAGNVEVDNRIWIRIR